MNMSFVRLTLLSSCLVCILFTGMAEATAIPKQVQLVTTKGRLIASNVRTSRFHEFKLGVRERVHDQKVGNAVIVVITSARIVAYGVLSGWREMDLKINEVVNSTEVEDYGALVQTNKRLINFNGQTGAFGRIDLPIRR